MVVGADRVNIEVFSLALAHFAQVVADSLPSQRTQRR